MNETIRKFGYPDTLVAEYNHWVVLLRQKQITACCLVLACKETAQSLPDVSEPAFRELKKAAHGIETTLRRCMNFEKINYVILMMVDKEVHFHVIPRHSTPRIVASQSFNDPGWPKHPDFNSVNELNSDQLAKLRSFIRENWTD